MIECVWPPQISINRHGRVTVRRISASPFCTNSASRYSSKYFIQAPASNKASVLRKC